MLSKKAVRSLLTWEEALRSFAIVTPSMSIDVSLTIKTDKSSEFSNGKQRCRRLGGSNWWAKLSVNVQPYYYCVVVEYNYGIINYRIRP
jgi:hypothetical protein